MGIKYFPNRIFKKTQPSIDRVMAQREPSLVSGFQDLAAGDLDTRLSFKSAWQLNMVAYDFDVATAKDYKASVQNGREVVRDMNDYLWFQLNTTFPQVITLSPGFYTGTELAAHLKTVLDANAAFTAVGVTFTVAYSNATGLYTITPSSGTIRYLNVNTSQTIRTRDSIAGHLMGFNVDTAFAANVSSDTLVQALDSSTDLFAEVAATDLGVHNDDIRVLTMDQALQLYSNSNSAAVTVGWSVVSELIV